jgi:eukaryotic-like serine/threonine-protein kinase
MDTRRDQREIDAASRWGRVDRLFKQALDLGPIERASLLLEVARDDRPLAAEVGSLLDAHEVSSPMLNTASPAIVPGGFPAMTPIAGQTIGRYRVCRLLGTGGSAAVYEAQQSDPPRSVALKVLAFAGLVSEASLRRFTDEAGILARLRHPAIAQIYECGVHAQVGAPDLPYLAVEFVPQARSITDYSDDNALTPRARVELFIQVCDAVHHGHQRGVIHRDLKPSNILVDGAGRPKVIDFGVAKLADAKPPSATLQTAAGELIGTLHYMSPEQLDADPANIDVRSDVYSLGVVLYRLICGRAPHDLPSHGVFRAVQVIRDAPPIRPSMIDRRYRGDLELILLTALAKDPARRYQSAAELSADLRAYLGRRPIQARQPSLSYRLGMLLRRNPVASLAVGASIAILIGGTAASLRAAAAAREEQRNVQAVAEFLAGLLSSPETQAAGAGVRVVDILGAADQKLGSEFATRPRIEQPLRLAIGRAYDVLDQPRSALAQFERAHELALSLYGPSDPRTLASMVAVAGPYYDEGDYVRAEGLLTEVLAAQRRQARSPTLDIAKTENDLALVYLRTARSAQAESLLRASLETRRRLLGPDHAYVAQSLHNLAVARRDQGDLDGAEDLFREAIRLFESNFGAQARQPARSCQLLAEVLAEKGDAAAAEDLAHRAVLLLAHALGESHSATISAARTLAQIRRQRGKTADVAEVLHEATLDAEARDPSRNSGVIEPGQQE